MHHVAKFVLQLLSEDQRQNHVDIGKELVDHANGNDNFVQNVVRGNETWV
jgi:hypothetical protein